MEPATLSQMPCLEPVSGDGLARDDIPTVCPRAILPNGLPLAICHLVWPLYVPSLVSSQAHFQKCQLCV